MHRDLKPENLIFADSNIKSIKIADFGLALKLKSDSALEFLKCGSPGYIAPEILRDEGYNCSSDIFGVGVILFALLTGYSLFKEDPNRDIT